MDLPGQFPGNSELDAYSRNNQARKRPRLFSDFGTFEITPNHTNEQIHTLDPSSESVRLQELFNTLVGNPVLNNPPRGNNRNPNISRDFNLNSFPSGSFGCISPQLLCDR